MMRINVPRAMGLAGRRLDGHPITVMEQVAVCELAVEATQRLEKIQKLRDRQESDFDVWWEKEGLIRTYDPGSTQAKLFDDMFKEVAKKAWDAGKAANSDSRPGCSACPCKGYFLAHQAHRCDNPDECATCNPYSQQAQPEIDVTQIAGWCALCGEPNGCPHGHSDEEWIEANHRMIAERRSAGTDLRKSVNDALRALYEKQEHVTVADITDAVVALFAPKETP